MTDNSARSENPIQVFNKVHEAGTRMRLMRLVLFTRTKNFTLRQWSDAAYDTLFTDLQGSFTISDDEKQVTLSYASETALEQMEIAFDTFASATKACILQHVITPIDELKSLLAYPSACTQEPTEGGDPKVS